MLTPQINSGALAETRKVPIHKEIMKRYISEQHIPVLYSLWLMFLITLSKKNKHYQGHPLKIFFHCILFLMIYNKSWNEIPHLTIDQIFMSHY